ncbi:MAG TPA: peptidoglycan-binding protein [Acidimicrobiales bacterium]|nr:peptidoglycan-binding protein [Acidimicrobiales bacterium]
MKTALPAGPALGRRVAILLIASLVCAACLAACGSGKSTTSPTTTVPELDSPSEGVEVIASSLQLELLDLGYQPGPVNGQFTPATQTALRKFQTAHEVPAPERGALGPTTAAALAKGKGGSSVAVQALQSALTDVGLFNGTINGQYGPVTLAAVEALQRKTHITADGFYGPETAGAFANLYDKDVPEPPSTTVPTTAPTTGPPTSGSPPSTVPDQLLKLGSEGPQVTLLQERLTELGYRPGVEDGVFGASTASAVLAFQKRNGLARDGTVGPQVEAALAHPTGAGPRRGLPVPRIEVDIARQIAFVVLASKPVITLNVSTGNGETYTVPGGGKDVAYTPVGTFTVIRKLTGDERAPLGTLHNPMYFYKGWAIHGSPSVPAYPASHGCVRISNADADWLFPLAPIGTPVILYDTTGKSPGPDHAPANAAPGY